MKQLLFIAAFVFSLAAKAQTTDSEWLLLAEKQQAELNETAAQASFEQAVRLNSNNYAALWKLAELYSRFARHHPNKKVQQSYFAAARANAARAISVNPNGADGYYCLAVVQGRQSMTLSGKERVNTVKEIHTNILKALRLNPNHARAWHVLGKWNYEVANLGFMEKAALKVIYGGLPPASTTESIRAFERALQLEPDLAAHYLELAKALHSDDQDARALQYLRILPTLPNKTPEDGRIKAEGAKLMKELLE